MGTIYQRMTARWNPARTPIASLIEPNSYELGRFASDKYAYAIGHHALFFDLFLIHTITHTDSLYIRNHSAVST